MEYTKKLAVIAVACLFAISAMQSVNSATTDTFDITVTGEYLWIDITNATWAIGVMALSISKWTNQTGITFIADIDNCTVNTDLSLQITTDGATWKDASASGADEYRLNASINVWVAENLLSEVGDTTISSGITAGQNESFDLRFDSPTSSTTSAQQSITITATIVKS